MTEDERLAQLRRELDELGEAPLSSHPETLERVHRALVDELDALADVDAADPARGRGHGDQPDAAAGQPAETPGTDGGQGRVDQDGGARS